MSDDDQEQLPDDDLKTLELAGQACEKIRKELSKVIVGQDEVIEQLLLAMLCQGHCLLEGVPGLAKTLIVSTLSHTLHLDFNRVQFTPDLMPTDITGTEVIQEDKATGQRSFKFLNGPIFSNIVLADEINRTPPKTQAALLEAMQERHVTVGGVQHDLPEPFFVLATQNPIEQEGTYPLPEAQQDRFMFKVVVRYPSYDEEYRIAETTTSAIDASADQVLSAEEILQLQSLVKKVPVAPFVIHYVLRLIRATRVDESEAPDFALEWINWGVGPRGVQYLLLAAKARAMIHGRCFVSLDDIKAVAHPVLRHRIIVNYNAQSNGISADEVVNRMLYEIPERRKGDEIAPVLEKAFT